MEREWPCKYLDDKLNAPSFYHTIVKTEILRTARIEHWCQNQKNCSCQKKTPPQNALFGTDHPVKKKKVNHLF